MDFDAGFSIFGNKDSTLANAAGDWTETIRATS
jgi:hypothetical protein